MSWDDKSTIKLIYSSKQFLCFKGTLNGSISSMKAHELGSAAITGALIRSNVRPEEVSDVIMGQVSVKNIANLEI